MVETLIIVTTENFVVDPSENLDLWCFLQFLLNQGNWMDTRTGVDLGFHFNKVSFYKSISTYMIDLIYLEVYYIMYYKDIKPFLKIERNTITLY